MGRSLPATSMLPRPTAFIHTYNRDGFYFETKVSEYFPLNHVVDRLNNWSRAVRGYEDKFRDALNWYTAEDGVLYVRTADIPNGFKPLSDLGEYLVSDKDKARIAANVCEALSILHQSGFVMGFLSHECIYFHPDRLDICLDVQPYPSTIPFINQLDRDFPFGIFSRYTRTIEYRRIADFYAISVLMQWLFTGTLPEDEGTVVQGLPENVKNLCTKLVRNPEMFLFAEEVQNALIELFELGERCTLPCVSEPVRLLHPMEAPITEAKQACFRDFLRQRGPRLVAVISDDDSTRTDVVRMHFNEVLESDLFVNIECKNMPFATLREVTEHTLTVMHMYFPELTSKLGRLNSRLEQLLRKHYEGDDVIAQLSNWLVQLYEEITPIFARTSLYFNFESCENFDDESMQVLTHFWREFGRDSVLAHVLMSGRKLPKGLSVENVAVLQLDVDEAVYRRLLLSQLGRADHSSFERLMTWCTRQRPSTYVLPIVLETMIHRGQLELVNGEWYTVEGIPAISDEEICALIRERLLLLDAGDMEELRVLACLPSPIRPMMLYRRNGLSTDRIPSFVLRLVRLGLLRVYHENSILIPEGVACEAQRGLSNEQRSAYNRQALRLQHGYKPTFLPALIELARSAGEGHSEYYFLVKYYRQIRSMISYQRRLELLEMLKSRQEVLRRKTMCWDRLLCELYTRLNEHRKAEQLAAELYARTGLVADKISHMMRQMFLNELDLENAKPKMFTCLCDETERLSLRIKAALFLMRSDFYLPLSREEAQTLDRFYRSDIQPNTGKISVRNYIQISISYTIMLLINFPEQQDWAHVLLEMLQSTLEGSPYVEMMVDFYDAHIFQTNISSARKYVYRSLETTRRLGFKSKEQVGHLNGMELALYQGDVESYEQHKNNALRVDDIKRADLKEQYVMHQLNHACEWERWELFSKLGETLEQRDLTHFTMSLWPVYKCYGAFRRNEPLPERPMWQKESQHTLFVDALYAIKSDEREQACSLLQRCINANSYHLTAGWAYRELITLLLESDASETLVWLNQFDTYIKSYAYDVFWPDYYRLSAEWSMRQGDVQQGILYLRRGMNLYQLIGKHDWCEQLENELTAVVKPHYLPRESSLWTDTLGKQLLTDRERFLNQSLDLLVILQLSQQVTESLDLNTTCRHLTNALFDYFPVTHVTVRYQLAHRVETVVYSASGLVDTEEFLKTPESNQQGKFEFSLYRHGNQCITLDIHLQLFDETKQQHMKQFLSVIKPHIANSIHYLEMMTDNLTGFYQRRYFVDQLSREMTIASRYGLDLSVMMIDIDNFRKINEFGHPEGDRVLRELASVLRSTLRRNDVPGRYGGEEILVILPKTDGIHAAKIAEKIRQQIEDEFVGRPYKVTVSIGVSSMRLCNSANMDELVSFADNAEIRAKTTGKNKVEVAWNMAQ